MLKVKITEKDAKTKKEMANSSRHSFRWIDLDNFQLTKKAGFIHTGAYQDFTLIVFDFDLSSELKGTNYIINNYNWFKKIGETKPYLKVMTPSGGMHLYFIFKEPFEYMNKAKIPTFDPNVVCDIRGKNGIIFSPYTKFEDEKFKEREYFPLDKHSEKILYPREYLDTLFEIFQLKERKDQGYSGPFLPSISNPSNTMKNERIYENIEYHGAFKDVWEYIYNGMFKIQHGNNGDVPEFVVWGNLWRWIYKNNINFETAKCQLEKTQPAFNREETDNQLKYLKFEFPPSKRVAQKLFSFYLREMEMVI